MAKCLVLGANGFVGSHLVDSLINRGNTVRAFDRFSSGHQKFNQSDKIEVVAGNYLNKGDLKEVLKDIEYVFHFISTTTPASAEDDPIIDIETNIRMSVELLQLCSEAGVKRVIYASSGGAIYGTSVHPGVHSEDDLTLPISPYAIGKLTVENYLRYFHKKFGLDYTVFRIANPYGERQPHYRKQGVIPIFLERVHDNLPITLYGDGSMTRDYVYVKDVAEMISSVFGSEQQHHVYNIGSGQGSTLNEIIDCIKEVTRKEIDIRHEPAPSTYVDKVVLDINRYKDEFHITPQTTLLDGIRATYDSIIKPEKEHI